jgi:hypothetical protein
LQRAGCQPFKHLLLLYWFPLPLLLWLMLLLLLLLCAPQGAGKWLGRKVVTTVEVCVGGVGYRSLCTNLQRALLLLVS